MKATDLRVGMHVLLKWHGHNRFAITHLGQGHGNVHRVRQVDVQTGAPGSDSHEQACSSRDIEQTWEEFLRQRPDFFKQKAAAEVERASREALMEQVKEVADETATLLSALGFEARVVSEMSYGNLYIRIDNPTENQEMLRDLVAKKWGL